jgi:hypothetical protein
MTDTQGREMKLSCCCESVDMLRKEPYCCQRAERIRTDAMRSSRAGGISSTCLSTRIYANISTLFNVV